MRLSIEADRKVKAIHIATIGFGRAALDAYPELQDTPTLDFRFQFPASPLDIRFYREKWYSPDKGTPVKWSESDISIEAQLKWHERLSLGLWRFSQNERVIISASRDPGISNISYSPQLLWDFGSINNFTGTHLNNLHFGEDLVNRVSGIILGAKPNSVSAVIAGGRTERPLR